MRMFPEFVLRVVSFSVKVLRFVSGFYLPFSYNTTTYNIFSSFFLHYSADPFAGPLGPFNLPHTISTFCVATLKFRFWPHVGRIATILGVMSAYLRPMLALMLAPS